MFRRKGSFLQLAGIAILVVLAPSVNSSQEHRKSLPTHRITQPNSQKLSSELLFQIKIHAFLLWASIGFLVPVGIILIRMSSRVQCGRKLKVLFYSHVMLQLVAVMLVIGGAVHSIKNFENSFNNTHQRIGLALYAFILVQPLTGFFRPNRGVKLRSLWYFAHWIFGTGVFVLGVINIYIGLYAYHEKTLRSVRMWSVLFTVEVATIVFVYLLQDRWEYMQKQGVILGDEQIRPTDQILSPQSNRKELQVRL